LAVVQSESFEQLSKRIEQGQRKALVRTFVLAFATVAIAAIFLVFTLNKLEDAHQQLTKVTNQVAATSALHFAAQRDLEKAQRDLKAAQDALKSEADRAAALQNQVTALQAQLATLMKQLAEALDLGKHVYKLEWGGLKEMATTIGAAVNVLDVIEQLKSQVHWGMSNTPAGGYNSPGFAKLVLQRLNKLPADGNLDSLPHNPGAPVVGDIVVYEGGYHLFYFKDHAQKEFVIGMTPFGVLSLNYDFGKRVMILRTGYPAP